MKRKGLAYLIALCCSGGASAGGLTLPGAGVVSATRAGAAVASADDAEAIVMNPAGIAKSHGTVITIGLDIINYFMSFQRAGTYDPIKEEATSYAGTPYPKMTNNASPALGIGAYQPVPLIGIVTDFGGRLPTWLHFAAGLYAPNAYPFRNMNNVNGKPFYVKTANGYDFPTFGAAPPPSRYDIIEQEAAIILPSIVFAANVTPDFDVGVRYSAGFAHLKSTLAVWGLTNYEEWDKQDGLFTLDANDNFLQTGGLGATYRVGPHIEFGANYTLPINIHAKGDAYAINGPAVSLNGASVVVLPTTKGLERCEAGGTAAKLKGCVDVELPMTAQIGARYKFLDSKGKFKGDIELDLDWEHAGAACDYIKDPNCQNPSDYRVVVDAQVTTPNAPDAGIPLKDSLVQHGLQDVYAVRLGGSYQWDVGDNIVVARGGIGYDSAAAKAGWERADLDGAARTMISAGGSYKLKHWSLDAGFGVILEGTRTSNRNCNPTGQTGSLGCNGTSEAPVDGYNQGHPSRTGPDPADPVIGPAFQVESPVNQGTFTSHYIMIMLGASTWF